MGAKNHSGWTRVAFGDVVSNGREATKDPAADGLTRIVGLDHLEPGSLSLSAWDELDELPDGTSFSRVFRSGQVLFGKRRAYQRKVAVPEFDGVCSGDLLVFVSRDESKLLPEFLPCVVQSESFFEHALSTSAGSLSPRTSWKGLSKFEFDLPPLDEQRRIVGINIAGQRAVNQLHLTKESLLVARMSFLRKLADGSSSVPLGELAELVVGRTPPRAEDKYWTASPERPFCTIADMKGRGVVATREGVTDAAETEGKAKRIAAGTLLMSFKLTVGRVAIAGCDLFPNEAIVAIKPYDLDPAQQAALELLLPFAALRSVGNAAVLGKTLNLASLKNLSIPSLSVEERSELIRIGSSLLELEESIETRMVTTLNQSSRLRESLMVSFA